MTNVEYLIIGSGVAGITAAQEIRHVDPDGRVLVVSDEGTPYYYRASLSEWIAGKTTDDMLPGRTPSFYEHMHISQKTGHAVRVDPEAHQVHLADGEILGYDRLLIATGARANVLSISGLAKTDQMAFRSLADARTIKERLGCCGQALILGGGVLGLELAGALFKMGIQKVAVVHRSGFVGRPLLDPPAGEWLQERMQADGITLFLNDTIGSVEGQTAYLESGHAWDFDVFVQAIGITPVFPETPGLTTGKGIRIDNRCRTNLPHIYAAGDCTETRLHTSADQWQTTRIWLYCARQGKTAGRNIAGRDESLADQPFFNASIIYTVLYTYVGQPHGNEGEVFVWQNENLGYRKLRVVDGRLTGALLLGERGSSLSLIKAMGQPVARFGADIAEPSFPWNEVTGQDWDYLFY